MQQGRQYEILSPLGQGGFGAVYRARMKGEGGFTKEVALKILKPELAHSAPVAERLREEARLLGRVRHRAIVQVDALLVLDGRWTMVMELVDGPDLKAVLEHGPVPLGPALEIAAEVAGALHAGWTALGPDEAPLRLTHRDIKPANICVTRLGEVKVLDFGISRAEGLLPEVAPAPGEKDEVFGTPEYMAPERFRQEGGPDADVYALGATLYELLGGARLGRAVLRPVHHFGMVETRLDTLGLKLGDLGAELRGLLSDMLAYEPAARPDAREVERRLSRLRRSVDGLTLKDWAEQVLPAMSRAHTLPPDAQVGAVLFEHGSVHLEGRFGLSSRIIDDAETFLLPESRPPAMRSSAPPAEPSGVSTTPTVALSRAVGHARTRPLEGRDDLLDELAITASAAAAGEGQVVLLVGEAGIGKTRLAEEAARRASHQGFGVAWGRCWEAGEAPAGWPWSEALGRIHAEDPRTAAALPAGHRAALRALVPELEGPPSPARSPEEERSRLGLAVASWLAAAGEQRPWWIVLDDLHAVDPLSLFLLRSVGRGIGGARVVLVCTWRDAEVSADLELSRGLSELSRGALHVQMPRLDRPATERLLLRLLPGARPETLDALWQSTLGQPLFVHEMARIVQAGGPEALDGANVPAGVREAVRLRLSRLPAATRALLEAGALLGPEAETALLSEIVGQPEPELLRRLREAERMGILERSAAGHRFAHPLFRRALDESADPERRLMLHRSIAEALERRPGTPPALITRHWREAGPDCAEASVDAAVRASREAVTRLAWEEAVSIPADARATLGGRAPALEARLLIQEGVVRVRLGQVQAGRALALRAAGLARALGLPALLSEAALAYGGDVIEAEVDETLVSLLREALAALPAEDTVLRARVLARLAGATQPALNPMEPVGLAREALAVPVQDPRARLDILVGAVSAMVEQVPPGEYLPYNQEALALAERLGDATLRLRLLLRLVGTWWELGDMATVRPTLLSYERAVEEAGLPAHRRRLSALRAGLALSAGELERAGPLYAETIAEHREAGDLRRASILAMVDAQRRWILGEHAWVADFWAETRAAVRREPAQAPPAFLVDGFSVPSLVAEGRHAEAQIFLERLLASPQLLYFSTYGTYVLSEAILACRDVDAARQLYHRLLPWRDCVTGAPAYLGYIGEPVQSVLGRLALLSGMEDEALEHLEAAARWCRSAESWLGLRLIARDRARALRAAGRDEEAERVEAEADLRERAGPRPARRGPGPASPGA